MSLVLVRARGFLINGLDWLVCVEIASNLTESFGRTKVPPCCFPGFCGQGYCRGDWIKVLLRL